MGSRIRATSCAAGAGCCWSTGTPQGLALPERDLWLAAGDDARAAGRYAELTGRRVSGATMDLYRLRWDLDDIALSVRDFRAPHEQNEDTALMWEAITEEIGEIG